MIGTIIGLGAGFAGANAGVTETAARQNLPGGLAGIVAGTVIGAAATEAASVAVGGVVGGLVGGPAGVVAGLAIGTATGAVAGYLTGAAVGAAMSRIVEANVGKLPTVAELNARARARLAEAAKRVQRQPKLALELPDGQFLVGALCASAAPNRATVVTWDSLTAAHRAATLQVA